MKGKRVFTKAEVKMLLDNSEPREKAIVLLGVTYCTRIGEALALTFGDFDGNLLEIVAEKNGEKESYPIPDFVQDVIQDLRAYYNAQHITVDADTPLFLSRKGNKHSITTRQALRMIQDLCDRLGIQEKIGTHSLRKAGVTHYWIESGYNAIETMRYSRHKTMAMLLSYVATMASNDLVHKPAWV